MQKIKLGIVMTVAIAVCAAICACGSTEKTPLPAPQNVHAEQRELVWDEVKNAAGYVVRYQNTEHETSENRYDLSELTEPNTYEIKVLAIGDNKNNVDSEWTTYNYTVIKPVEHGYDESGLEYTLLADGTGYEVSRGNHKLVGVVEIPDYYYTLPVKRIASDAFFYKSSTSFPNPYTGQLCNIITTDIQLPSRLESIGEYALSFMVKLTEVVIPDTVTEIEKNAFYGCKNLKRVTLPKGLKYIPELCFGECALDGITFPETLERIGFSAFGCSRPYESNYDRIIPAATKLIIPDSVKSIDGAAFYGWLNLKDITLPNDLERLEWRVFYDTAWYDSQPNGYVMFGDMLYKYKDDSEENAVVEIPSSVKRIAGGAFERNNTLTEVYIPDGVKLIGGNIFDSCQSLSKVRLPADLTAIPDGTFSGCKNLIGISLPDEVTEIGEKAFIACTLLETVKLSARLKTISRGAFTNCYALNDVVLPNGVKEIGENAFWSCKSLTEITIPHSVEVLGKRPFFSCAALRYIYYDGSEAQWMKLKAQNNDKYIDDSGNLRPVTSPFTDAIICYYSETAPEAAGNYWHYVDNEPTLWS